MNRLRNLRHPALLLSLLTLLALLLLISSTTGKLHFLIPQLPGLLTHQADPVAQWLFWQLWLPRTLVAVGVGAALALSGSVFQLLTRNPLGSPDIIGINAGASAGAVTTTLIAPMAASMMAGALTGALLAVLLILLASDKEWKTGTNLIVGGLAVNFAAMAIVLFGITGVRQEAAMQMQVWLSGSLGQRSWEDVAIIWCALVPMFIVISGLKRSLTVIHIGFEKAGSLGVAVNRTAWLAVFAATVLSAAAVVAAGPVAFLALAAPHICRQLFKNHQYQPLPIALTGACLLMMADLLSRLMPMPQQLPVGIVMATLGSLYLCCLLLGQWRQR